MTSQHSNINNANIQVNNPNQAYPDGAQAQANQLNNQSSNFKGAGAGGIGLNMADRQKKYNTIDTANMHNNVHGSQGSNIAGGGATIS